MPKKMIKPGPDLLTQVNQAFLDNGYSGLSMVRLAKVCGFTQRALYYYFSNKEEAFRAMIAFRQAESVKLGLEAGRTILAKGGNARRPHQDSGRSLRRYKTPRDTFSSHRRPQCGSLQALPGFDDQVRDRLPDRSGERDRRPAGLKDAEAQSPLHARPDCTNAGGRRAGRQPGAAADRKRGLFGPVSSDLRDGIVWLRRTAEKAEIGCCPHLAVSLSERSFAGGFARERTEGPLFAREH